jgi:integrase
LIALWLGHEQIETTQVYLHADLELKERALAGSVRKVQQNALKRMVMVCG